MRLITAKGIWTIGILLLIAIVHNCSAADTWLTATVASYHTDRNIEHNERNWGLGVEHGLTDHWRVAAGGYRNSYWRDSLYIGGLYLRPLFGPVKAGVLLGLSTGYDRTIGPFAPVVLPTLAIEGKQVGVNIGVMPSLKGGIGVMGLQIKARF